MFLITASVYLAGAVAYGLMASGERQDWSRSVKMRQHGFLFEFSGGAGFGYPASDSFYRFSFHIL